MARRRRGNRSGSQRSGSGRSSTGRSGGGRSRSRSTSNPVRKLLINSREAEESRIAILEGGSLEEYYIERESLGSTLGNIYKARITNVEKSIGAAFVEFGHERQGFLHVSDLCMDAVSSDSRALLQPLQDARRDADDDTVDAVSETESGADDDSGVDEEADPVDGDDAEDEAHAEDDDEDHDEDHEAGWDPDATGGDDIEVDEDDDAESSEPLDVHAEDDDDADDSEDDADDEHAADGASDDDEADDEDDDEDEDEDEDATDEESEEAPAEAAMAVGAAAGGGSATATPARPARQRGRRRSRRGGGKSSGKPRNRDQRELPPIQEILQKGQEIVVQVIKDGIGNKGPTLTTYLSIPGRFVVLMPGIHKRGVSRKVDDPGDRDRLKTVVSELECPEELGFIVRTAGLGCSKEDLQRDLDYLLRLWDQMKVRVHEHEAPVLLYQENDLVIRTLRDLYDGQGEVVIDDPLTASKAREFMGEIMPSCVDKIIDYEGERPLFSHHGLENELGQLLESRIELKSGATLIMEQTEALVAIDVNSSRYKGKAGQSIEETAFNVNAEAADEIARQIRLRDLGGLVVVDFIDMRLEKHRKSIERQFKEALRKDRARIKVARLSPFGLIELTRQRVRTSLKRSVHQQCPYCSSTGFIPSDETSCLTVVRKIRDNLWKPGRILVVTVRPEVAEAVLNSQRGVIADLERESGKEVFVRADHRLAYEDVELRSMVALPSDMDHRRA